MRPADIPQAALNAGCRILAQAIKQALANEKNRADFEAWKDERRQNDTIRD